MIFIRISTLYFKVFFSTKRQTKTPRSKKIHQIHKPQPRNPAVHYSKILARRNARKRLNPHRALRHTSACKVKAEKLGICADLLVQLTSLTGRLLRLHSAFGRWTGVAWNHYKTRVNRAWRLLGISCTPFGRLQVDFGLTWGRPGRTFGPPWSSWGCLGRHFLDFRVI